MAISKTFGVAEAAVNRRSISWQWYSYGQKLWYDVFQIIDVSRLNIRKEWVVVMGKSLIIITSENFREKWDFATLFPFSYWIKHALSDQRKKTDFQKKYFVQLFKGYIRRLCIDNIHRSWMCVKWNSFFSFSGKQFQFVQTVRRGKRRKRNGNRWQTTSIRNEMKWNKRDL